MPLTLVQGSALCNEKAHGLVVSPIAPPLLACDHREKWSVPMWVEPADWQREMNTIGVAFALRIAGVPVTYYSGHDATTLGQSIGGALPRTYSSQRLLSMVGNTREDIAPLGGVAESGAIDLTLGFDPLDDFGPGSIPYLTKAGDPRVWLLGKGEGFAGWTGRPLATVAMDVSITSIEVDTDPTPLITAATLMGYTEALVYIGAECMAFTGVSGTGTVPDPWVMTGLVRAVVGTVVQRHLVDGTVYNDPLFRERPIKMRGRRAVLYIASMDGAFGEPSEWHEVRRGVLNSEPRRDGHTIRFQLIDHLARLRGNKVDIGGETIRLLRSHRVMEEGTATAIELAQVWPRSTIRVNATTWNDPGPNTELIEPDAYALFLLLGWTGGVSTAHPRRIPFLGAPGAFAVLPIAVPTGTWGPGIGITFGLDRPAIRSGYSLETAEIKRADIVVPVGGVVEWPEAALEAIALDMWPSTVSGISGAWADMSLGRPTGDTWHLGIEYADALMPSGLLIETWGKAGPRPRADMDQEKARRWTLFGPHAAADKYANAWHLIDLRPLSEDGVLLEHGDRVAEDGASLPVRGPCLAGYQSGERYISVGLNAAHLTGEFSLQVEHEDAFGDSHTDVVPITSSTAIVVGGDTIGYALEVKESARRNAPSFGEWPGTNVVAITPVLEWLEATDPADVLLSALLSHDGDGVAVDASAAALAASAYNDRFGGLALTYDDVDIESFRSFAPPAGLSPWNIRHSAGDPLSNSIEQLLVATGSGLTVVRRNGTAKIARVQMGFEGAQQSRDTIGSGDWTGKESNDDMAFTSSGASGEAATRIVFDIGASEGFEKPPSIAVNFRSDEAEGDREARTNTVELPGLALWSPDDAGEALTRLGSLASRVRSVGARGIRWSGGARTSKVRCLNIGDVVTVTSPELQGEDPTADVDGAVGRVLGLDIAWTGAASSITITTDGTNVAGYGPSARLDTVPTATTVTVVEREFALDVDPNTGAEGRWDIDYFAAGDVVTYEPPGATDNGITLTILSITRATRTIEFTAAHTISGGGFAVGGTFVPEDVALASVEHLKYAQLASTAGVVTGVTATTIG